MPDQSGPPPCPYLLGQCAHVFHCPTCGAGSCHPGDAENQYCGNCGYVDAAASHAQERSALEEAIADSITHHPGNRTGTPDQRHPVSQVLARAIAREVVAPRLEQLRDELARRTREWQEEQQARIKAEQATIAADQRAQQAERERDDYAAGAAAEAAERDAEHAGRLAAEAAIRHGEDDGPACRVCGCTDNAACPGSCTWIPDPTGQGDLCSNCDGAVLRVTAEDLETGERGVRSVPAGNYILITTDPCTYDVMPLADGKRRITVKNIQDPRE